MLKPPVSHEITTKIVKINYFVSKKKIVKINYILNLVQIGFNSKLITIGGRMSTQQSSSSKMSSSIDTSHLKVKFPFKSKYGNYINGKFVEPKSGKYFDNTTPITNEVICKVPRSNEKDDIDFALDAAHAAFPSWGKTSITERSNILLKLLT